MTSFSLVLSWVGALYSQMLRPLIPSHYLYKCLTLILKTLLNPWLWPHLRVFKCHRLAMGPEQNFISVFFTFEASNVPKFNIIVYHFIIILTEGYMRIILSLQPQEHATCKKTSEFSSELHMREKSYFQT